MSSRDEEQPLLGSIDVRHSQKITRRMLRHFLDSKIGHYLVLTLVALDVSSIFIEFILQLEVCDARLAPEDYKTASEILKIISLVFSSLFMLELLVSIWAFGKAYFHSWFHWFDGAIIVTSFIVDLSLGGIEGEIGSLVVVLRLWRVVKIIEELSAGAEEQSSSLQEEIAALKQENEHLHHELDALRQRRQTQG